MKYKQLSVEEREKIQEFLWQKASLRSIAKSLGRSHSSILRELNRHNRDRAYQYKPRLAHERALAKRKSRGRKDRLKNQTIREYVVSHLKMRWSPEQISGRIRIDLGKKISHEAIYQYIYAQVHRDGWGLTKPGHEDLRIYLRRRRKRRGFNGFRKARKLASHSGVSIDQRPLVVAQRKRIGDWEGDTLESKDHKPGLNTLVERKTGLVLITKLSAKTTAATTKAIEERFAGLPMKVRRTLTLDNGFENQDWRSIESRVGIQCFYAHAYHSWERGTNENTNGLIREYFPKKTDFTKVADEEIQKVEYDLNARPRKRLNWSTPLEVLSGALTD